MRRADDGAEALEVGRSSCPVRRPHRRRTGAGSREALSVLRGGLLQSCARGLAADARRAGEAGHAPGGQVGPTGRAVLAAVLARPLAAARADPRRGSRAARSCVDFRWAAEVGAFTTLAAAGLGPAMLEAAPGWPGIDGRVLVSLGRGPEGRRWRPR